MAGNATRSRNGTAHTKHDRTRHMEHGTQKRGGGLREETLSGPGSWSSFFVGGKWNAFKALLPFQCEFGVGVPWLQHQGAHNRLLCPRCSSPVAGGEAGLLPESCDVLHDEMRPLRDAGYQPPTRPCSIDVHLLSQAPPTQHHRDLPLLGLTFHSHHTIVVPSLVRGTVANEKRK